MSSTSLKTTFLNVQITVARETDAAGKVIYKVTSANPEPAVITQPDTILNYQLVAPTPADVVFTGLNITPANSQFSKPAISTDGKNLTISDINTQYGDFRRSFEFNGEPETRDTARLMVPENDIENRPPPPPPPPPASPAQSES